MSREYTTESGMNQVAEDFRMLIMQSSAVPAHRRDVVSVTMFMIMLGFTFFSRRVCGLVRRWQQDLISGDLSKSLLLGGADP